MRDTRALLTLGRWLGPWASESTRPGSVTRVARLVERAGCAPLKTWVYRPQGKVERAVLVCSGVHYDGPTDVRLDRLCRIIASSGVLVMAPFFSEFMRLRVGPRVVDEAYAAFGALLEEPEVRAGIRPGIFSISFGSLPALRTAAAWGDACSGVVAFGGFADPAIAIEFALTGRVQGEVLTERDPLNHCVVYLTLLHDLPLEMQCREQLERAWLLYARRTWGRPHLRRGDGHRQVAQAVADELKVVDRQVFMRGCGLVPGSEEPCMEVVRQRDLTWMDPRPVFSQLRAPVTIIHGADDDVIPLMQSELLEEALRSHVPVARHITGLFGHTGGADQGIVGGAKSALAELSTMSAMLTALARLGRRAST